MQPGQLEGWVLYDDSCGFCRRWASIMAPTLRARGYDMAPLQSLWVRERLGIPDEKLLEDILLLRADGVLIRGADVYRFLMRRIWWAAPVGFLAGLPVLRSLFDQTYRAFAKNRHCASRCIKLL